MSNDSGQPATTSRKTGRPPGSADALKGAAEYDHAIRLMRGSILKRFSGSDEMIHIANDLKCLGEFHERKALLDRPFYTVQRLMERYGLARKTVERLPIPRFKIGGAVRYAEVDVEAYEAQSREGTPSDAA